MSDANGDAPAERLEPTGGRFSGLASLVVIALVVITAVVYDEEVGMADWVYASLAVAAVLVWAAMLRPRVSLTPDDVVLRNMLETVWVPLAAVERVDVHQLLAIEAGGKKYVSPSIGRSRRQIHRDSRIAGVQDGAVVSPRLQDAESSYGEFVEERIRHRAADARDRRGIKARSPEQAALAADVRRRLAWPEIVALAVTVVALAVTIIL